MKAFIDANKLAGVSSSSANTPAVSPKAGGAAAEKVDSSDNEEDCLEDPDYLMVKKKVALPTMGTNFQVK